MKKISLYRYIRPDGGVTVSTEKPECEYTELHRILADEGMLITNGETLTPCTDTDNLSAWSEVPEFTNPNEATDMDYLAALREMGVCV